MSKPREFFICDETDNSGYSVRDWSEKEAKRQFGSCNVFHVIEYSAYETLTAKVAELEKRLEVAHYNIELRTKENHDIINNHDESRWTYWRKRSGEMTDAWRDQRDLALTLTAKVKRYEDAMVHIHKMGCAYKGNLTGCPACYICNEFPEFNEMNKRDRSEHGNN